MARYMLSWMGQKYRAMELKVFRAQFTQHCLIWEPGDWRPPSKTGSTVVTAASPEPERQAKSGADALAILLDSKPGGASYALGRDASCEVVLDDATVSSKHLVLTERSGAWYARGLGSTNGTFVNNKQLAPEAEVPLSPADKLRLGQVNLTFYDPKGLYFRLKAGA